MLTRISLQSFFLVGGIHGHYKAALLYTILKANNDDWEENGRSRYVVESLVSLSNKRSQLVLHVRTLNFTFLQIMFLHAMFFGSLKNFFFGVSCHGV